MLRLLLFLFIATIFHGNAIAKDDDGSIWPEAVREAKKKSEIEREQREKEKNHIAERVQWIIHEDPNLTLGVDPEIEGFTLPKGIMLDGGRYHKFLMIESMLHAAFSNSLWYDDSLFLFTNLLDRKKGKFIRFPRHHVINKWSVPIKVTFKTLEDNSQVDQEKFSYLISHLKELIDIYGNASGLDISYVYEEFPNRSDANVFIVLNAKSRIQNVFKNNRAGYYLDENDYEVNYISAVRFTPFSRSQVEGFFIPNAKNEIKNATCYLKPSLVPKDLTKALLTECMARILGFPEFSTNNKGTLSNWNVLFRDVSASTALDHFSYRKETVDNDVWIEDLERLFANSSVYPVYPNEFDLRSISMLYCPSVSSGMDKYEASLSLLSNRKCLKLKDNTYDRNKIR